jgi:hypothetical protein
MNRAAAIALATSRVIGHAIKDCRAGRPVPVKNLSWAQWLAELADKHRREIQTLAAEMLNPKPTPRCWCGVAATTVIAGGSYCNAHVQAARDQVAPWRQEAN